MDEIVTQLGLILSQLRVTRRAVEDIERSTARYGGFGFASALAAGPKFGEPPMFAGALKVYVVNINDLAPGGGSGSFLEALLGGVGRFFGGFIGGLAGGTIGGVAIPFMIGKLERLAILIDRILDRMGLGKSAKKEDADKPAKPGAGMDLQATLEKLNTTLEFLTGMFTAAGSGPDDAGKKSKIVESDTGKQWLAMLTVADSLLARMKLVVDGLILLVPILVGALAQVIIKLSAIKEAFLGLLQFALRNTLLVRGVVLTTVFDTIGAAASLMVRVLTILQTAVDKVLSAAFNITGALLDLALGAIAKLSAGLKVVVDAVVTWIEGPVLALLAAFADTLFFRFIMHLVRILPAILPPLYELKTDSKLTDTTALDAASKLSIAATLNPATKPPSVAGTFPDFAAELRKKPDANIFALKDMHQVTAETMRREVGTMFTTTIGAIRDVDKAIKKAATDGEALFNQKLHKDIGTVKTHAQTMADALKPAVDEAKLRPETGLEAIAKAYEDWVQHDGLKLVLGQISEHFKKPENLPGGPPANDTPSAPPAVPVTIEIKNIIIELEPGAAGLPTHEKLSIAPFTPEKMVAHMNELAHEMRERGADDAVSGGALYGQLGTGA